jgi:hypothetical protein
MCSQVQVVDSQKKKIENKKDHRETRNSQSIFQGVDIAQLSDGCIPPGLKV